MRNLLAESIVQEQIHLLPLGSGFCSCKPCRRWRFVLTFLRSLSIILVFAGVLQAQTYTKIASYAALGPFNDVVYDSSRQQAYASSTTSCIVGFDISNPAMPVFSWMSGNSCNGQRLAFSGNLLAIAGQTTGVTICDLSTHQCHTIAAGSGSSSAKRIATDGGRVFFDVSGAVSQIRSVDSSGFNIVPPLDISGKFVSAMTVCNGQLYVAYTDAQLREYDLSILATGKVAVLGASVGRLACNGTTVIAGGAHTAGYSTPGLATKVFDAAMVSANGIAITSAGIFGAGGSAVAQFVPPSGAVSVPLFTGTFQGLAATASAGVLFSTSPITGGGLSVYSVTGTIVGTPTVTSTSTSTVTRTPTVAVITPESACAKAAKTIAACEGVDVCE